MKLNKILLAGAMLFAGASAIAQETITEYSYVPNWYLQGQFGGQETLGENKFGKLLCPNAQIAVGYNFNPYVGARLAVNAWQSKASIGFDGSFSGTDENGAPFTYAVGPQRWKWNYVAPTVDVTVNLTNLIGGYNPYRVVDVDLIAGLGANIAFNNKEANEVNDKLCKLGHYVGQDDLGLGLIWDGTKTRFLGQFGLDLNFNVSQHVSLGLEFMANVLPDGYNSKKANNADWYFNGLAGIRYTFGPKYNKTTRTVEVPVQQPQIIERIIEKVIEAPAPVTNVVEEVRPEMLRRDIFFRINTYSITKDEMFKVNEVAEFLKNHPNAKVVITGYADKGTGTLAINLRLSKQRAEVVANTLKKNYNIAADRIIVKSMGEAEEQPYADPVDNRVAICVCE
ncbi:MAG: OmpA family protein [Muribaculaceae bacterium]|nr:OmpA family protein [Muribaculaceae bacterium]